MRTLSFRSIRRASALASRSAAGTLIWNSCFNPSTRVSVTCMVSIFFRVRPWPSGLKTVSMYGARDLVSLRRWFGEPAPTGQALQKFVMQTLDERLVRAEGLEPPQLSSLEPKSSASTSSATPADSIMSGLRCLSLTPKNAKRFSARVMLQVIGIDQDDFRIDDPS